MKQFDKKKNKLIYGNHYICLSHILKGTAFALQALRIQYRLFVPSDSQIEKVC